MIFYSLHLQTLGELDHASYASNLTELNLYLNHLPEDDVFQTNEILFVTKLLADKLNNGGLTGFILGPLITAKPDLLWTKEYGSSSPGQYCRLFITGKDAATDF
jgi:hypothetical protein